MKLVKALELAEECGLETVSEAIRNVQLHSMMLFTYENIATEYNELLHDWDDIREEYPDFDWSTPVTVVLDHLRKGEPENV